MDKPVADHPVHWVLDLPEYEALAGLDMQDRFVEVLADDYIAAAKAFINRVNEIWREET